MAARRQPARADDAEMRARIVAAARACFAREGVSRTWIATVAAEVGIARQTLYTFVGGRRELVELALAERCRELTEGFVAVAGSGGDDVRDTLVELLATMVESCRDDPEFALLAGAMDRAQAFFVLSGPSVLRPLVDESLAPVFARARETGTLREDRPEHELAGWVQTVLTPLAGRTDLDAPALRDLLRHYALPALLLPDT